MPIDVRIHDNTNNVRVKPSTNDVVNVETGCNAEGNRLEHLIKEERKERIAADQYLLLNKEDKIKYIEIFSDTGTFDTEVLNLLISNRLNRIIYGDNYYILSIKDGNLWRYKGGNLDPNIVNTIIVDVSTGEWVYSPIGNTLLQHHLDDVNRHLREGEREFWNNKLNFEIEEELLEFNRN